MKISPNKTNTIIARLTKKQMIKVIEQAKAKNMSISQYIRLLIDYHI